MVKYTAATKYHEFLSAITQFAADGIVAFSQSGKVILANPAAASIFGRSVTDIEGNSCANLFPDGPEQENMMTQLVDPSRFADQRHIEFDVDLPGGGMTPIEISVGNATLSDGEEIFIANIRDISKKREAAKQIALQAEILDQMHDAVVVVDNIFQAVSCNDAYLEMLEMKREDVIGKNPYELFEVELPDNLDRGKLRAIVMEAGEWSGIIKVTNTQGKCYTTDTLMFPLVDKQGNASNFISVIRDVGDRLEAERRIQETQRIEALGRLAGGVAHDINNLLFPIFLSLEDVVDSIEEGADLAEAPASIRQSMDACMKIKEMIERILYFSRESSSETELLDAATAFTNAWTLAKMIVPSSFDVNIDIQPGGGFISATAIQLSQLLLNLVSNAVGAHEGASGKIAIELCQTWPDASHKPAYYHLKDQEYAVLKVTDSGCGIPDDIIGQIFDPFFTTKDVGEGTGLGLTEVAGILRDIGGAIDIESELGKGTTFLLYFPIDVPSDAETS